MKIFKLLTTILFAAAFAACAAGAGKHQDTQPPEPAINSMQVESINAQTAQGKKILYRHGSKDIQTLAALPVLAENNTVILGKNIILQAAQQAGFNTLYVSVTNPAQAKEDLNFDASAALKLFALDKAGAQKPLKIYTQDHMGRLLAGSTAPEGAKFYQGQLYLNGFTLAPGQSKGGVLFFEKRQNTYRYKLLLTNLNETFEIIFIPGEMNDE